MKPTPLTLLRFAYGLFFAAMGVVIALATLGGRAGPAQPTARAQALTDALTASGIIDPLLSLSFLAGGLALVFRRSAPLGLVLLAPAVAVIFVFHLFLSGQWPVGVAIAAAWLVLAWSERRRLAGLWHSEPRNVNYGADA